MIQQGMKEKIREIISKEEYERFHADYVRMWDWLSQHPDAGKLDYFAEFAINFLPYNACYGCEVVMLLQIRLRRKMCIKAKPTCSMRPLIHFCHSDFDDWSLAENDDEKFKYAEKIRDIAWYSYEEFIDQASKKVHFFKEIKK